MIVIYASYTVSSYGKEQIGCEDRFILQGKAGNPVREWGGRSQHRRYGMGSKKDELAVGSKAPQLRLRDSNNNEISLEDMKGKWVVLYFYPKDNTSGCTQEAIDFSRFKKKFEKLNAVILGVSPDSIESHCKFIEKHNLSITLLSDTQHGALESYGAWQLKKMYGKEFMGVERSTFLIDPEGRIREIWRKVKVNGHVEEVQDTLLKLTA